MIVPVHVYAFVGTEQKEGNFFTALSTHLLISGLPVSYDTTRSVYKPSASAKLELSTLCYQAMLTSGNLGLNIFKHVGWLVDIRQRLFP